MQTLAREKKNENAAFKRFVRSVLVEDFDGGGYAGDYDPGPMGYGGPWGVSFGGPGLFKTFVQPFVDVFRVATAETKKLAAASRGLLKSAFEATVSMIVPFVEAEYDEIWNKQNEKIKEINQEYADVYKRIDDAFAGDDVRVLAFLVDPLSVIAVSATRTGGGALLGIAKTLTGLRAVPLPRLSKRSTSSASSRNSSGDGGYGYGYGYGGYGKGGSYDVGDSGASTSENVLREKKSFDLNAALSKSPAAKDMSARAKTVAS